MVDSDSGPDEARSERGPTRRNLLKNVLKWSDRGVQSSPLPQNQPAHQPGDLFSQFPDHLNHHDKSSLFHEHDVGDLIRANTHDQSQPQAIHDQRDLSGSEIAYVHEAVRISSCHKLENSL